MSLDNFLKFASIKLNSLTNESLGLKSIFAEPSPLYTKELTKIFFKSTYSSFKSKLNCKVKLFNPIVLKEFTNRIFAFPKNSLFKKLISVKSASK